MERNNILARLFRAISGKTQKQFALATGLHPITVANIERGEEKPRPEHLEDMAAGVGLQVRDGVELLRLCETLRNQRRRPILDADGLFEDLEETVRARAERLLERLPALPQEIPRSEIERRLEVLRPLDETTRRLLALIDEDYDLPEAGGVLP